MGWTASDRDKIAAKVKTEEVEPALKEIASRLKRLSFRDIMKFAGILDEYLKSSSATTSALLAAADTLENA